jgi:hypothetical protein
MPHVITITTGDPETGLWCTTCLLPSLVRIPLYRITESGVTDYGTVDHCFKHE